MTAEALTVDAQCHCERCARRTADTYVMTGKCGNCRVEDIAITYRRGDDASPVTCPVCGVSQAVRAESLRVAAVLPSGGTAT